MNVTPLLTQVRTAYFSADCGMAYIMRMCDGKFVLIDSNWGEYEEPEHLLEILNEQNTLPGKTGNYVLMCDIEMTAAKVVEAEVITPASISP